MKGGGGGKRGRGHLVSLHPGLISLFLLELGALQLSLGLHTWTIITSHMHTHMHPCTHLFLFLYSPCLLQLHWSKSSHIITSCMYMSIHYRFREGEESLWWRCMARPGDRGISDSPPGGESQRSAHDFSVRNASSAAGNWWPGVMRGRVGVRGFLTIVCSQRIIPSPCVLCACVNM